VNYRQLDAEKIVDTARVLATRVGERFPTSGLAKVAADIAGVAEGAAKLAEWLDRPIVWLRLLAWAVPIALVLMAASFFLFKVRMEIENIGALFQAIESAVNDLIFAAIAVWFAFTLEARYKREKALALIAQLRSLAHVIDMHQLTKDPQRSRVVLPPTSASPKQHLSPAQLTRYLDYCSEMLSILGKLAALCVQKFDDPVTLTAVDELEDLTGGLSQRIWQKIMILDREFDDPPGGASAASAVTSAAAPVAPVPPVASPRAAAASAGSTGAP
jgi:hypothetical protein